ncbi:MAG: ABC transporter ATP-binding protein [Lachnospiraceae bacterium]|nr:ABC transporter ATP-binding protein [Lachnospiraceae bacterium]
MNQFIRTSQGYASWFGDSLGGIREIKVFGIYEQKYAEFLKKKSDVIDKQKEMNLLGQWNNVMDNMILQVLTFILYILGANLVFRFQLSVGSIFAFITYSSYVTGPISSVLNIGYFLSGIIPSSKRYFSFMNLQEEDIEKENNISLRPGKLELKGIFFSYFEDRHVLDNINISFPDRSKTAIIGENGSGKSTIINLLLRIYEPIEGRILLNDINIFDFALLDYRKMIAVVSQQIYLFNDTIRNNICLYKEVSDEKIRKVCRDSTLEEFINEKGLDYIVGNNGTLLSGGQKQKIALARALLCESCIIIFDEATSNADTFSEKQINGLLHTKLMQKTVIIITHKREVLKDVENIVILKNGKVLDQGCFKELLKRNFEFRKMVE